MEKPAVCEDCEQRKVLVNVELRLSKGGDKWLCRDCWYKREAPFMSGNYRSQWD